jgi:hypothetical protein
MLKKHHFRSKFQSHYELSFLHMEQNIGLNHIFEQNRQNIQNLKIGLFLF